VFWGYFAIWGYFGYFFLLNSGGQKLSRVMFEIDVRPIFKQNAYF